VAKLDRFPTSREMLAMRERWDREDAGDDVPLKDFDTTLTSTIDGTINQLVKFKGRAAAPSVERDNLHDQAVTELRAEIVALREAHAKTVTTLNLKASKTGFIRFEAALAAKVDKRLDTIAKWIGVVGTVFGILGVMIAIKR
jgi:hypothetical protein